MHPAPTRQLADATLTMNILAETEEADDEMG